VVKDANGQAVRNAAGGAASGEQEWQQEMGGMELKTDNDGKTNIDGSVCPLRVQVLAPGSRRLGRL